MCFENLEDTFHTITPMLIGCIDKKMKGWNEDVTWKCYISMKDVKHSESYIDINIKNFDVFYGFEFEAYAPSHIDLILSDTISLTYTPGSLHSFELILFAIPFTKVIARLHYETPPKTISITNTTNQSEEVIEGVRALGRIFYGKNRLETIDEIERYRSIPDRAYHHNFKVDDVDYAVVYSLVNMGDVYIIPADDFSGMLSYKSVCDGLFGDLMRDSSI